MPPNFSPGVQIEKQSSMKATKDDNLNPHLCETEMCLMALPYGSKCHDEAGIASAHPTNAHPVCLHVHSDITTRLQTKTLARLVSSSPRLGDKRSQKVVQASFPLCARHNQTSTRQNLSEASLCSCMTQHSS